MAAWSDWNWPEPSAATTASAYVGQPSAFAGWATATRATHTVAIQNVPVASGSRRPMIASAGIVSFRGASSRRATRNPQSSRR